MRRLIFDVSMARGGGGFTYAVNVLPVLARRLPDTEILVVLRSQRIAESLPALPNLQIHLMPEEGLRERVRYLYREAGDLAERFRAELYFSASELSPVIATCPRVSAFRNPNLFTDLALDWPLSQRLRIRVLNALARYSARVCSRIVFVSHDSSRWIGEAVGIPAEKRVVIPHGVNPDLWSMPTGASPFSRPFILSVSNVYRYKNFVKLIEGWTTLAQRWPDIPDLVIVGDDYDPNYSEEMVQARLRAGALADRIHIVGEVPYAEISRYYLNASAFVFPSYLETFGHPLLEAMAASVPVVASDIGVFREVGSDAVVYCSPHDDGSIANSLERVLGDLDLRQQLIARGHSRVESYSWSRTVDGLEALFTDVMGPRSIESRGKLKSARATRDAEVALKDASPIQARVGRQLDRSDAEAVSADEHEASPKKWQAGSAPVAVLMIALNEGHNMEEVLQNLSGWAQEVFLVDSFSQDDTVDIALRHGVDVVQRRFRGFGDQWNFAMSEAQVSAPWTMKLDPDERLTEELKREIEEKTRQTETRGFFLSIRLFFMGRALPVRLRLLRLWRTGSAKMSDVLVNEHIQVDGKLDVLRSDIEHHDSPDLDHWLEKQNRYTTAEAIAAYQQSPLADEPRILGTALQRRMWLKKNFSRLPFRYLLLFLYHWLWNGTWRAGWVGYAWAHLRSDVMRLIEYKRREIEITGRIPVRRFYGPGDADPRVRQYD